MRCVALALMLVSFAASAHAQKAPAAKPASSDPSRKHKRVAPSKPRAARAAHEHAGPKSEPAPKAEAGKPEVAPKADKPGAAKAGHAESAPKADKPDAPPAPSVQASVQASDEVRKEGDTQVKMMEFSGLDIEGQLKTPQMLYFLNRLRAEFGHPRLPHRSFMPELERSTKEGSF